MTLTKKLIAVVSVFISACFIAVSSCSIAAEALQATTTPAQTQGGGGAELDSLPGSLKGLAGLMVVVKADGTSFGVVTSIDNPSLTPQGTDLLSEDDVRPAVLKALSDAGIPVIDKHSTFPTNAGVMVVIVKAVRDIATGMTTCLVKADLDEPTHISRTGSDGIVTTWSVSYESCGVQSDATLMINTVLSIVLKDFTSQYSADNKIPQSADVPRIQPL